MAPRHITTADSIRIPLPDVSDYVPESLRALDDLQRAIPRIAKLAKTVDSIRTAVSRIPTVHHLVRGDAREMNAVEPRSVHLVVTSPPYWTLKEYRECDGQMGHIADYDEFLDELDRVWQTCREALVPGGRVICIVGDVCLSRRNNGGRHTVVPLHSSIQERCRKMGFDNLSPIIWHKIANAAFEANGNGGGFLGKPYEPNSVIKNDIEYILMLRKPGGYRNPDDATRILSLIGEEDHRRWFQPIWSGLTGASTRQHPAPYPVELANRLIRMFSFVGDTVLDPFAGTGSTAIAAAQTGRNSVGYEIDPTYFQMARKRFEKETASLFRTAQLHGHG